MLVFMDNSSRLVLRNFAISDVARFGNGERAHRIVMVLFSLKPCWIVQALMMAEDIMYIMEPSSSPSPSRKSSPSLSVLLYTPIRPACSIR